MSDMESQPRAAKKFEFTPEGSVRNNPHEPSTSRSSTNRRLSSRPSRTTVVLIIAIVLLLVALVIVSVFLGIADRRKSPATASTAVLSDKDVCMTEECAEAAARINSYINKKTLPCDDFYQFACGGWLEHNVIPDYRLQLDILTSVTNQITIAFKNMLEDESNKQESRSFNQSKIFFKSCMSEHPATDAFNAFLENEFKHWPLIRDNWIEIDANLTQTLSKLTIFESSHLFSIRVIIDEKNTSRRVLELSEPSVSGWSTDDKEKHIKLIKDIAGLLKDKKKENDIDKLLDFQSSLQTLVTESTDTQKDSNDQSKAVTKVQLQEDYSIKGFEWNQYLDILMTSAGMTKLDNNERIIIIKSPLYFKKLGALLTATDQSIVTNYIIWKFVYSYNKMLGNSAENIVLELVKDTMQITATNARYVYCVIRTYWAVGVPVLQMYVKNTFKLDSKNAVRNLTNDIQRSVTELLNHTDWMNVNLKQALREKSEQMSIIQPEIMSPSDVDKHYSNYHFDEKNFFTNTIFAKTESFKRKFSLLRAVGDKKLSSEITSPFEDNYSPLRNQLIVGLYASQPPLFSNNYPWYLNYGATGSRIARQLMFKFGITGKYLSKQNTLDYIRQQTNTVNYGVKERILIEQYSRLKDYDGKKNIAVDYLAAEVGGIKVAFMAYKKWQAKHGKLEQLLPSVKFDQDQLFFLSYAQTKCEKYKRIGNNTRADHSYERVMIALKNSPEFATAFHCSANSAMNPEEKCAIW